MKWTFLVFLLTLPVATAHLDMGLEVEVDGFLVDFGYSPRTPTVGEQTTLSFILFDAASRRIVPHTEQVFFVYDGRGVSQYRVPVEQGQADVNYTYTTAGTHTVGIMFFDGSTELVRTELDIPVSRGAGENLAIVRNVFFGVTTLVVVLALILRKKKV